ncbi:hypothetical protein H4219_003415 [Mycoemilia scoparia]|uniref:HTH La-type RNA-binding domain-containing protein n=1 Tax=Mycoemilia scoparia TaxID=417184 RepID=A0A9W7ZUV8_9FUNG|nr:hypothetical protein H4219_003415 [Mycoemilia scoparia]
MTSTSAAAQDNNKAMAPVAAESTAPKAQKTQDTTTITNFNAGQSTTANLVKASSKVLIPEPAPAPTVNVWAARKQAVAGSNGSTRSNEQQQQAKGASVSKDTVVVSPSPIDDPTSWPDPATASATANDSKHHSQTHHDRSVATSAVTDAVQQSSLTTASAQIKDDSANESAGSATTIGKKKGRGKWIPLEADIKYTKPSNATSSSSGSRNGSGSRRGGDRKTGSNSAGGRRSGRSSNRSSDHSCRGQNRGPRSADNRDFQTDAGKDRSQEQQTSALEQSLPTTQDSKVADNSSNNLGEQATTPAAQDQEVPGTDGPRARSANHGQTTGSSAASADTTTSSQSSSGGRGRGRARKGGDRRGGGRSAAGSGGNGNHRGGFGGQRGRPRHHHQQQHPHYPGHHFVPQMGANNAGSVLPAPAPFPQPIPQTEADLKLFIQKQVEYYFSVENLCKDVFFRTQMDAEGYVPLTLISGFNRVRMLTSDMNLIIQALEPSKAVETNDAKDKVRKSGDWSVWLFPKQASLVHERHY